MQIEKYKTESTVDNLIYTFESVGEKVIQKMVIYSKIENPEDVGLSFDSIVYNLGFGDFDYKTGELDDQIISKNGDTEKVLATVANTVNKFWTLYPNASIFFMGSVPDGEKPQRTRLYQMKINRYFFEIINSVDIRGYTGSKWENFEKNENYTAFLISRKKQLF
jgi:hypothetical protein